MSDESREKAKRHNAPMQMQNSSRSQRPSLILRHIGVKKVSRALSAIFSPPWFMRACSSPMSGFISFTSKAFHFRRDMKYFKP